MPIQLLEKLCPYMVILLRVQLQAPYRNPNTPEMLNFNRAMSTVRVSVEWLFSDITNYFRFVDLKKKS